MDEKQKAEVLRIIGRAALELGDVMHGTGMQPIACNTTC